MTLSNSPFSLDQYQALRSGYGIFELPGWSSVTLTGTDRQRFLNSFCTNDVKRLAAGEHCEAFLTNVKGKVIGHGLVDCRDRELVFITVPAQAVAIIEHLDRYIIREDVQLRDTTGERAYVLVAGGDEAGAGLAGERWIRWRMLHVPFCGVIETTAADAARARQAAIAAGAIACDEAAFNAVRIESGTPLFGIDFNQENLPQEVGRDEQAISFAKGCYLGQETVARIDALGHVNQQLGGLRFAKSASPLPGSELICNGTPAGHVTSITFSPQLSGPLALGMIRRPSSAPETRLDSAAGPCEVIDLPVQA